MMLRLNPQGLNLVFSTGGKIVEKRSGFKAIEYLKDLDNWKSLMTGGGCDTFLV